MKIKNINIATSWNDVTLKQLDALRHVNNDDRDAEFKIIDILSDLTFDDAYRLDMNDFNTIMDKLKFLNTNPDVVIPTEELVINGRKFTVTLMAHRMTAAQFLDYNSIMNMDVDKKNARVMACFTIPDNHSYNDGYDTEELIDFLWNNLSVQEVANYTRFFMILYKAFAEAMVKSSIRETKKMKIPAVKKKELITQQKELLHLIKSGGFTA